MIHYNHSTSSTVDLTGVARLSNSLSVIGDFPVVSPIVYMGMSDDRFSCRVIVNGPKSLHWRRVAAGRGIDDVAERSPDKADSMSNVSSCCSRCRLLVIVLLDRPNWQGSVGVSRRLCRMRFDENGQGFSAVTRSRQAPDHCPRVEVLLLTLKWVSLIQGTSRCPIDTCC